MIVNAVENTAKTSDMKKRKPMILPPGKLQTTLLRRVMTWRLIAIFFALLRKVMTWRLIAIFFATVIFFINLSGCVFNALS